LGREFTSRTFFSAHVSDSATPRFVTKCWQVVDSGSEIACITEIAVAFSQQFALATFGSGLDAASKLTMLKVSANFFA